MFLFFNFFFKKKDNTKQQQNKTPVPTQRRTQEQIATRKGELGEYKINIQLDQLPKEYRYLSDLFVKNPKAKSGYSQIDHLVIAPYGIIVIETKNYQGTIYGSKNHKSWLINGKFKMGNPFVQNYGHIQALKSFIDTKYHDLFISMVSFTKRCTFKVDLEYRQISSNELIVYDIELSEFIHRKINSLKIQHQEPLLNEKDIVLIYNRFANVNITDLKIREQHNQILKSKETEEPSCVVCNKPVSEKVKLYCLSNNKFNGKIYCYDHQK